MVNCSKSGRLLQIFEVINISVRKGQETGTIKRYYSALSLVAIAANNEKGTPKTFARPTLPLPTANLGC